MRIRACGNLKMQTPSDSRHLNLKFTKATTLKISKGQKPFATSLVSPAFEWNSLVDSAAGCGLPQDFLRSTCGTVRC